MTTTHSPDHTPATQATEATALDSHPAAEPAPTKKPAAAGFASLFSAAAATSAKSDGQHWNQKGNKSAHEKKIGPAPNGTRRSMGKR